MRCLVVGCGSIGARRARILAKRHDVWCQDADAERALAVARSLPPGRGWVYEDGEARQFDVALICTPPDSGRAVQIERALAGGLRGLYVEKPLAVSAAELDRIGRMMSPKPGGYVDSDWWPNGALKDVITMGACNLRFVGGLNHIHKLRRPWRLLVLKMGQAAKFWNPEHRTVSLVLDSIHELDLAASLQGPIQSVRGYSTLDKAEVSLHHAGEGLTHIFLDRVTDPPVRDLRVYHRDGDEDYLRLNTHPSMYEREMAHFMDCVERGEQTCNPLSQAAVVCLRALEIA